jgi:hypothetical protein
MCQPPGRANAKASCGPVTNDPYTRPSAPTPNYLPEGQVAHLAPSDRAPADRRSAVREPQQLRPRRAQSLRQARHHLPSPSWARSTWTIMTPADFASKAYLSVGSSSLLSRQVDCGMAAQPQFRFSEMLAKRARPAGPAQSSVFHNFARRGPTKEAHRRALNRPDGLLRSVAGQVDPNGSMTKNVG